MYRRAFPGVQRAVRAAVASGGGGGDTYLWYPALNLNDIPFHAGAGAWGPQEIVQAPAAPVTTREVTVTTASGLQTEAATPGTRIIVNASISDVTLGGSTLRDIDIILNDDIHMGRLTLGNGGDNTNVQRVRVRASLPNNALRSSLNTVNTAGASITDIIFDGIGMRGRVGTAAPTIYMDPGTTRLAIVNCVGRADQAISLLSSTHTVIAGCNFASGYAADPGGGTSRWTLRAGASEGGTGPFIVYNSRLESLSGAGEASYHRLRFHPRVGGGQMYMWASNLTLVDSREARGMWVVRVGSNGLTDQVTAAWCINSTAYLRYLNSGAYYSESYMLNAVQNYARATGVTFYGDLTLSDQQAVNTASEATDKDHTTGCTFNAWQDPPAWGAPGSPLDLPT